MAQGQPRGRVCCFHAFQNFNSEKGTAPLHEVLGQVQITAGLLPFFDNLQASVSGVELRDLAQNIFAQLVEQAVL